MHNVSSICVLAELLDCSNINDLHFWISFYLIDELRLPLPGEAADGHAALPPPLSLCRGVGI